MKTKAALWARVSSDDQTSENQVIALRKFAKQRGFKIVRDFVLSESAFNGAHRGQLNQALAGASKGEFNILLCWALDRLSREGIEAMLGIVRQFRQRGVQVLSLQESWLDGPPDVQELLTAFFAWMAQQESNRRSEGVRAGLARRKAQGLPVGRQVGPKDHKPRRRSGYYARWEATR